MMRGCVIEAHAVKVTMRLATDVARKHLLVFILLEAGSLDLSQIIQ